MGLLTTKAAAERLGVTVVRVHQLIKDQRLPAEKFGRDYLIDSKDLALVKKRKAGRPPKNST
jgi:excisionase family DNA binding protein